jgi:hypothetical protein
MPEDILGIFRRFTLWKKESVWAGRDPTHVLREYTILSYTLDNSYRAGKHKLLNSKPFSDISGKEKCKIPQHGRGTKCSGTYRGHYHSQNFNFSEESFILISFCYIGALARELRTLQKQTTFLLFMDSKDSHRKGNRRNYLNIPASHPLKWRSIEWHHFQPDPSWWTVPLTLETLSRTHFSRRLWE